MHFLILSLWNCLLNPRYIFQLQANVWIIIFSYVGNYFWTHYFFTVLGASYTFPSWRMNNVRSCSHKGWMGGEISLRVLLFTNILFCQIHVLFTYYTCNIFLRNTTIKSIKLSHFIALFPLHISPSIISLLQIRG